MITFSTVTFRLLKLQIRPALTISSMKRTTNSQNKNMILSTRQLSSSRCIKVARSTLMRAQIVSAQFRMVKKMTKTEVAIKTSKSLFFKQSRSLKKSQKKKIVVYRRPTQFLQSPERPQRKRLLIDSLEGMQSTPKILVTPKNQSKPLAISPTKESMFK